MDKNHVKSTPEQAGEVREHAALNTEIVRMLYEGNARSLFASIAVAAALAYMQYRLVDRNVLIGWGAFFLLVYGMRSLIAIYYHRDASRDTHARKWLNRYRLSTGFCGLAWGLAGVALFPASDTAHQAFLVFALVGVSGGAIVIYSIDAICLNAFIGSLLILAIPRFLVHGSHFSIAIAALYVLYVIYVTLAGRRLAQSLRDNIVLRIAAYHNQEKVHQLAYFDALTNLPNRRLLMDRLNHAFIECKRSLSYGAVLFIDLDNFKNLNDTKGHAVGDLLLQQVAMRLQKTIRDKDTVARIGGDEFVVVLEDLGGVKSNAIAASRIVAEKLIKEINHPFNLNRHSYHSSPSIGISLFFGQDFSDDEVLKRADIAMYQAKRLGRNNLQFYDENLQPALELRASLENDLRFALPNQQFIPYYQIQVDKDHKILGAEVLLRWQHPTRGFIPPIEFIRIAEESRLIISIGNWVLMQACLQLKAWQESSLTRDLRLSVNVSAFQFSQPDFVDIVTKSVELSRCSPNLLRLELTESLVLQDMEDVIDKMLSLKNMGISFSIDDFGTGHSSLSVLKRFPMDELKIDRSFVHDLSSDNYDTFIVQTIIAMGRNLGLDVIAEGVETLEQADLLRQYGCYAYQGFLFGKPLPLEAFEASLKEFRLNDSAT